MEIYRQKREKISNGMLSLKAQINMYMFSANCDESAGDKNYCDLLMPTCKESLSFQCMFGIKMKSGLS